MILYQIADWDTHFESAKSRTYNHRTQAYIPNKQHGLGYTRLVSRPNGPALYGAWIAVVMLASRQGLPRQGYLTDTGQADGYPLTADDLALVTRLPSTTIQEMLDACSHPTVGWITTCNGKDTTRIPQYPSDMLSPSPSPSPLPSPAQPPSLKTVASDKPTRPPSMAKGRLPDSEWLSEMRTGCLRDGIDFDLEYSKLKRWMSLPKNARKQLSRQRIVNWMNNADRTIKPGAKPKPQGVDLLAMIREDEQQKKEAPHGTAQQNTAAK